MLRRILTLAAVLLLLAGCTPTAKAPAAPTAPAGDGGALSAPTRWYPVVGAPAAEAGGTDVLTKQHVLLSELKGQVVYLNFWATWCIPCKEEMPALNTLSKELAGKVRFLAFDADENEGQALMAQYGRDLGLSLPLVWDEGKASRTYLVTGLPMSLVIDRNGTITGKKLGAATRQEMLDLIATAK